MMAIQSRHGWEQSRADEEVEDTQSSVDSIDSDTGHRNSLGLNTQSSISTLSRSFVGGSAEASRLEARQREPPSKGRVLDRINTAQSQEEQHSNGKAIAQVDIVQPRAGSSPTLRTRNEQAPQQASSTPQPLQNTTAQTSYVDLMSKTRIPNCTPQTFIFNKQGYAECVRTRFDVVVNGLWNKIRNDTFLFTKRNEIAFRLFQCQEAGRDMQPSIVCFCKPETVQNLRLVLSEKSRSRQFTSQIRYLVKKYAKRNSEDDHLSRGPPFRIYYWVGENPFLILHNRQHDIVLRTRRPSGDISSCPSTMCGSTIRVPANGRAATIAGTLKVGSRFNALTVAHAFSMPKPESQAELTPPRSASPGPYLDKNQENSTDPYDCDDVVLDTAEYDFTKPEETQRLSIQDLRPTREHQELEIDLQGESFMARVTTSESANGSTDTSDLDWALVELEDDSPALQNIFLTRSSGGSMITLDNLASCPPDEDREVFVLVADRDPIRGTLTRQAVSLSGITRFGPFSAYVITFDNGSKPMEGDSGALVVDATTHVVYAYIIALSPLGDAYAVPLMDCVQQIQDVLKVEEVHLPTAQDILLAQTKVHEEAPLLVKGCPQYSVQRPAIISTDKTEPFFLPHSKIRNVSHSITSPREFCRSCSANNFKVGRWLQNQVSWDRHLAISSETLENLVVEEGYPLTIIIAHLQDIRMCDSCSHNFQQILTDALRMPPIWFSDWCRKAGGAFGSEDTFDENGKLDGHNMWFRFDAKQIMARFVAGNARDKDYSWWKSNVFVRWDAATGKSTLLMLDPLNPVQEILLKTIGDILNTRGQSLHSLGRSSSPYFIISILAEAAVIIHDIAVWGIRDLVRECEKARETHIILDPTRGRLHAGMRHAIHVAESLASTRECINSILAAHKTWMEQEACVNGTIRDIYRERPSQEMTNRQTYSRLVNASVALSTLLTRAEANQRRLGNEIQLSMHELSSKTAKASQADFGDMRLLSIITTAFLPATFTASLFSTNFFYTNADTGGFGVSTQFWTLWLVLIMLTVLFVFVTYFLRFGLPESLRGHARRRPRHKNEFLWQNLGMRDVELSYERTQTEKYGY